MYQLCFNYHSFLNIGAQRELANDEYAVICSADPDVRGRRAIVRTLLARYQLIYRGLVFVPKEGVSDITTMHLERLKVKILQTLAMLPEQGLDSCVQFHLKGSFKSLLMKVLMLLGRKEEAMRFVPALARLDSGNSFLNNNREAGPFLARMRRDPMPAFIPVLYMILGIFVEFGPEGCDFILDLMDILQPTSRLKQVAFFLSMCEARLAEMKAGR